MSLPCNIELEFENFIEDNETELLIEFRDECRSEEFIWWLRGKGLYTEAPNEHYDDHETVRQFLDDILEFKVEYGKYAREAWLKRKAE